MSKKKIAVVVVLLGILLNIWIATGPDTYAPSAVMMHLEIACDHNGIVQLFYSENEQFTEASSFVLMYDGNGDMRYWDMEISSNVNHVRLDFPDECEEATVYALEFSKGEQTIQLTEDKLEDAVKIRLASAEWENDSAVLQTEGKDASLTFADDSFVLDELVRDKAIFLCRLKKIITCILIDLVLLAAICLADKFMTLPAELYRNRGLIWKLSKNDFKTRYAGSYLGIFWAFIQPVVTILVYWLVFDKGLNVGSTLTREGIEIPFVLWLTAGLVPWFFFQEALMNGTNALIEYNYLVKKVVFKISILPIIKIMSALFVHLFFVIFVLVLFAAYGYYPDLYTLQVVYYSFCMFVLVLALCYITCSVVVFFRDLSQIISIILQVGVWATPIMWQISIINNRWLAMLFKLNPMYYIVKGYRDALINKQWFFQDIYLTIYFWGFVLVVFGIGTVIFKRLKVHFADVL
jgi:teichoic acid transport system permease protein